MSPPPSGRSRRPYWVLVAFVALMVSPAGWVLPSLIAAAALAIAISVAREVVSRRAARAPAPPGAIVLGADQAGSPMLLSDRQLSAHGLIVGASGAGKSTTLLKILTDQIRRGRPVVAIDMKGSQLFARELAVAAAAAGRRFRLWSPDGPGLWNPLQHGNATELKDKLIATERFTEPHYQRAAERYVQTVLQVLAHARPERAPTLDDLVRLMDPRRLPSMLRGLPRPFAERVQDYLSGLTPDQHSAVRGLGTRLAILTESHSGPYLSPGAAPRMAIDIREALSGPDVVLFSLNSSKYGKLASQLGTLAIQDLVSAAGHRIEQAGDPNGTGSRGLAFIGIDEFSALGADHVISLLARGREADMSVLVATQELVDLDRAAPGLRDQVIGNTAVKIAHRQDVPSSAQIIAQMVGTEKTWEETRQIGGRLLGYDTGRGTSRQVEQFIIHPNQIKTLPTGDAVVISKTPRARARAIHVSPPQSREGPERG
jgi:conjugal transfer pilus assembly protein TraD